MRTLHLFQSVVHFTLSNLYTKNKNFSRLFWCNCRITVFYIYHFQSIRGRLGSLLMLSANAGFLFAFLAGYYLTYHQIPYVGIVISGIFSASFIFFHETPIFLLRHKKEEVWHSTQNYSNYPEHRDELSFISQLAEQSFRFYRNIGQDDTMPADISKEWNDLRARVEEMVQTEKKVSKFECKELCKFHKLMRIIRNSKC